MACFGEIEQRLVARGWLASIKKYLASDSNLELRHVNHPIISSTPFQRNTIHFGIRSRIDLRLEREDHDGFAARDQVAVH